MDEAAYVKASFLTSVAKGEQTCNAISQEQATFLLGTMMGGYNITPLIELLDIDTTAQIACDALSKTLLIYEAYQSIVEKSTNNTFAKQVVDSWANADWFTSKNELPKEIKLTVFRVDGEINTDDLSPATEAWSRPDIPLHAQSMLVKKMDSPLKTIAQLKEKGLPLAFVGDVVGTGSSRKSAINSVLWHMGNDIDYVPNKRGGGVVLGGNIAPIFLTPHKTQVHYRLNVMCQKCKWGMKLPSILTRGKLSMPMAKPFLLLNSRQTPYLMKSVQAVVSRLLLDEA
ncbi:Aconitate hydratase 2 (EC [uncultured Gammaproteobacteria bacterium]|nr:Aconitate hydratase 2 (EC [uncultured Gammaproteobacteria bacterium]